MALLYKFSHLYMKYAHILGLIFQKLLYKFSYESHI